MRKKLCFFPICNPFVTSCKIFNFFTNIHPSFKANVQKLEKKAIDFPEFDILNCAKFIKSSVLEI